MTDQSPPGPGQHPDGPAHEPATERPAPAGRPGGGLRAGALLAGAVALAFVVGAAATALITDDETVAPRPVGAEPAPGLGPSVAPDERRPLPEATLDGFDGAEPVELASYRGAPLVVNFWATWCAPCVKEMPEVQRVARQLEGRVAVLGVNVQDAPTNAAAFVRELDIGYDLASDPRAELYNAVGGYGMPLTLLVDAEGTIVYRHVGILDAAELRALLATHLGVEA